MSMTVPSDGDDEYHTFMKLTPYTIQREDTGVIIPQKIYRLMCDPEWRAWSMRSRLPSIHFRLKGQEHSGVRLADLLAAPVGAETGQSLFREQLSPYIRFVPLEGIYTHWPGQSAWFTRPHKPIDIQSGNGLANLGRYVAEHVAEFLKIHEGDARHGSESPWKGWESGRFDLSNLYLLQLDNVARGVWQPILSGVAKSQSVATA